MGAGDLKLRILTVARRQWFVIQFAFAFQLAVRSARTIPPKIIPHRILTVFASILVLAIAVPRSGAQANQWTWMGGNNPPNAQGGQPGAYGTLGVPAATNFPGARDHAVSWTDKSGNLWLFGGDGNDTTSSYRNLNDLWKFDPATNLWTWMSGSSTVTGFWGDPGVYGTLGQAAPANVPGGRYGSTGWTDTHGNLWLFGGWGCESDATHGFPNNCYYNDLWQFNPVSRQWAWMGGSSSDNQPGTYGTLGSSSTSNVPGARENATSWTDATGKFWLFGGYGYDSRGTLCYLNDLWQFDPATSQWAWTSGTSAVPYATGQSGTCRTTGQPGVYGIQGTAAAANTPGARANAAAWTDANGNLWMFGGYGSDASGAASYLNDLWEFNTFTHQWTWIGGASSLAGVGGKPGVFQSWMTPSSGNLPGSRQAATTWTDTSGNLWLFGGFGYDAAGSYGYLNDLWTFNPSTLQWSWMAGSDLILGGSLGGNAGIYGTLQTPSFLNTPSCRMGASGWSDKSGNLWLFGGYCNDYFIASGLYQPLGLFNDLWKFQRTASNLPEAAAPTFSPAHGQYASGQTISISDSTPGASIFYFASGSVYPVQYSSPLTLTGSQTIHAIATAPGYANSPIAEADYTVPVTPQPTFNPAAGTYSTQQSVAISDTASDVVIYYTTDGTSPTPNSARYDGPHSISSSQVVKAMAVASGSAESGTASAAYVIWPTPAINQWAWMGGNNTNSFARGVYGVLGSPTAGNFPGAHQLSSTWTDKSGNLWFFGGAGFDVQGVGPSLMNDLWKFNPSTSEWTWMAGTKAVGSVVDGPIGTGSACISQGTCGPSGVYGTLRQPGAANQPGGRDGAASWADAQGNLWLFGGHGYDSIGTALDLNDLWKFDASLSQWAWMGGDSTISHTCFGSALSGYYCGGKWGVYGTRGAPDPGNLPGGREGAVTWTDNQGNFWLFGGYQINTATQSQYFFNDLWEFVPSSNQWTWIAGSNSTQNADCFQEMNMGIAFCGHPGAYGTLQIPSSNNLPGSRSNSTAWVDSHGKLWLFGGWSFDATGAFSEMNDLWEFDTTTSAWTWIGGSSNSLSSLNSSEYGTLGLPSIGNLPRARWGASGWTDKNGNLWLFGGIGCGLFEVSCVSEFNDLWAYNPGANEWAWMGGSNVQTFSGIDQPGVYGMPGVPAVANVPGARYLAANWADDSGQFWLMGGGGYAIPSTWDYLNDFWKYQPSAPDPVPSFGLSVSPTGTPDGSVVATPGSSGIATISVVVAVGFNSAVALTAANLPAGVTATFNPGSVTGAGSTQVTIAVDASALLGLHAITITGTSGTTSTNTVLMLHIVTGPPPSFSLSSSAASLSMKAGGSGTVSFTVTPSNGFGSSVGFACSGLPAGTTCSFNPATVTPNGRNAVSTTLTIAAAASALNAVPVSNPFLPATFIAFLGGLFLSKKRRTLATWPAAFFLSAGLFVLAACGGGSAGSGGGGGGGTPPTTATVTVTATSGNIQQTTIISLTINH
jgi:N-acetylneuraminic acid mutarotase